MTMDRASVSTLVAHVVLMGVIGPDVAALLLAELVR
jgi:hypothetical protein